MTHMTNARVGELIIGNSPAIVALRDEVRRAARSSAPVLVLGPTGCGKELVAHGLHAESERRGHFVPFNAAAIPEALFESELLGHVRGAFSGALRDRPGLLRRAAHGTAFLDEVGDLPVAAQAKLLRVLDTHEVWPVGSDVGHHVDFRLVAATNVDLAASTRSGRFRDDLLFRLRGIVIAVPPLSARLDDIGPLVDHFAQSITTAWGAGNLTLTRGAMNRLMSHVWPGNVRELRHVLEYAAFLADSPVVAESHVRMALESEQSTSAVRHRTTEREELLSLLQRHAGDVNAVARALGVDRSTAYRRMQRLGVTACQARSSARSEGSGGSHAGPSREANA